MSRTAESIPDEPVLLREDLEGVTTLTLNRPKEYNALCEELLQALQSEFDAIAEDRTVRVVVLAGAGHAFCAGHSLKEMRAHPDHSYYQDLFRQCSRLMMTIVNLPQPVIARVHGIATAAGCQLVASCDLAVASLQARFGVSGVKLGLFCSTPSVALSRNVSRKQAFEMLITGDFIDAETAVEKGLVNRAVNPDELDGVIAEFTKSITMKSPVAVETGKRMFYRQLEQDIESAYDYASEVMACNMMAEDAVEGIDAFLEKRKPSWKSHC